MASILKKVWNVLTKIARAIILLAEGMPDDGTGTEATG